jgi:membrane protease YdiL (CAAX protease family)
MIIKISNSGLKEFIKYFGIILLANTIFSLLILILGNSSSFFIFNKVLSSQIVISDEYGLGMALILIILVMPFIEELAFRGWLSRDEKMIWLGLTMLFYFFILLLLSFIGYPVSTLKYLFTVILTVLPSFIIWKKKTQILSEVSSSFEMATVTSVGLFTLGHMFNFELAEFSFRAISTLAILLIPYCVNGYFLAKIRVEHGLVWSILLHVANNAMVLFPVLLSGYKP